ncbi:hypothetical protein D3C71_2087510 [compost metagenome]
MERLQPEHFLYTKPADDFCFYKYDSEQYTHNQVFDVVIPLVLQSAFIYTYRILQA